MVNIGDYVKVVKIVDDYKKCYEHSIGNVYEVKSVINCDYMHPLKYGLDIEGEGLCYFSEEELELMKKADKHLGRNENA